MSHKRYCAILAKVTIANELKHVPMRLPIIWQCLKTIENYIGTGNGLAVMTIKHTNIVTAVDGNKGTKSTNVIDK